jgi:SAM-dependent methyltransferase
MKPDFPPVLRCPACREDSTLILEAQTSDAREVREGTLRCSACGASFEVRRGVAHLLRDEPDHVSREAAGLERFAQRMRDDGWTPDKIRQLPNIEDGYWYVQGQTMNQLLSTVPFKPGDSILDVGSNTCWASNRFAQHGLKPIALDIATTEMQGLYTADYFLQDGTSYFERVLGSMNDIPIASDSLDYVFCCEVLHHNDTAGLRLTMDEIFRVLKPGGQLLIANETLKTLRDPVGVHIEGVEEFEGYEHAHWASRYRWEAIRAGFSTQLLNPPYHWFYQSKPSSRAAFRDALAAVRDDRDPARAARRLVLYAAQATGLGQRLYRAWLNHVAGGVQLSLIATKPQGQPTRLRSLGRAFAK